MKLERPTQLLSHWTEADEIVASVDEVIENAERHVQERLEKGEE